MSVSPLNSIDTNPTGSREKRMGRVAMVSQSFVLSLDIVVFVGIWIFAVIAGPRTILWHTGLFVSALSFLVWMTARWQLGEAFMIGVKARRLVTTGLYRRFKHPIYLFGIVAHFCALVALQNWWLLGAWLIYAPLVQWTRSRNESAALETAFGEAFVEHRRGTWI